MGVGRAVEGHHSGEKADRCPHRPASPRDKAERGSPVGVVDRADLPGERVSNLFQAAPNGDPAYHALIIGVSRYTHLVGGTGPRTEEPLANQLDQLSAAATSAVRVAMWIRDHFQHPDAGRGSIRLLVSPSDPETPLPGEVEAPP